MVLLNINLSSVKVTKLLNFRILYFTQAIFLFHFWQIYILIFGKYL